MFTEVAQPQHFPYPSQSPSQHAFNPALPIPIYGQVSQHGQHDDVQDVTFRQRFQKPRNFARPLQSLSTLSRQLPALDSHPQSPGPSEEHLLRRKTPHGTLGAAYDGTPVEWIARSHATKHFLMPISSGNGDMIYQSVPTDASHQTQPVDRQSFFSRAEKQRQQTWYSNTTSSQGNIEDAMIIDGGNPACEWKPNVFRSAGVDSMLNQGSFHTQYYNGVNGQQVPTVLQPMWPPCLGPTALNDRGPYGPYWPDGAYVPYRPAPLRDPRFHPQAGSINLDGEEQSYAVSDYRHNWSRSSNKLKHADSSLSEPMSRYGIDSPIDHAFLQSEHYSQRQPQPPNHDVCEPRLCQQGPLAYHGKLNAPVSQKLQSEAGWDNVSRSLTSELSPVSQISNAQFKQKALVWAHRVYVSLLASIHQSRRNPHSIQHQGDRHHLHTSIYPKPPRQIFLGNGPQGNTKVQNSAGTFWHNRQISTSRGNYGENLGTAQQNKSDEHESSPNLSPGVQLPHNSSHSRYHRLTKEHQDPLSYPISDHSQRPQISQMSSQVTHDQQTACPSTVAMGALEMLSRLCQESGWEWTDGMLLGGCLAYGLGDYNEAMTWYSKILGSDPNNVEAMSNLAATLLALNRRQDAEDYWRRSVKLRPSYFEAVEHLVGLLCGDQRAKEAVQIIEYMERALRIVHHGAFSGPLELSKKSAREECMSPSTSISERSDFVFSDRGVDEDCSLMNEPATSPGFGSSGYAIPGSDNGRMLALVHAKGNMLYALGDNSEAARAFEDAILIAAGRRHSGIGGLIQRILTVFSDQGTLHTLASRVSKTADKTILLAPETALKTARLVFPANGQMPGLKDVPSGIGKKAAVSTTSNSLLSLAKIYQDGMSSSGATATGPRATSGVQEILALYYLSLSLQPSPSTANNVGILLASVQQSAPSRMNIESNESSPPMIPGVVPGSGIALALAYYNYGLNLDSRHAHLYTNLGSLFKDIGQLGAAIKMYEKAVDCDGNFDIALANLANAVKDHGRISDAIRYYRRAVASNPNFAEAVCGLANALNSVCSWNGRGGLILEGGKRDRWHVDEQGSLFDAKTPNSVSSGWIERVVAIVKKQLKEGEDWGKGILHSIDMEQMLGRLGFTSSYSELEDAKLASMKEALQRWTEQSWEGAKVVRLVERATKRLGWQSYWDKYIHQRPSRPSPVRPQLPAALAVPSAPTVLPFHTFTSPLSPQQIRKISQRNGLRISCSTLRAPWLPTTIYDPPAPPRPHLNVGYVSSDFNNHPLAHLMQSVFGFHNQNRVKAFCYATTASDNSVHRQQIEREAPVFYDASLWSIDRLVNQVIDDGIHILVNLNGYTRGARNEVFAARPAPVQMSFMGFAGTLGAEWCDYLLADNIAIPHQTLRPWRRNVDLMDQIMDCNNDDDESGWVYGENIIFTRDTFFCCDHRQSAPDSQEMQLSWPEEQRRRWKMRKDLFPELPDDAVILGNFNQLYKIEPSTFRTWLRILSRIPKAVLWLLRFPDLGEKNLKQTAMLWAGKEVASRIIFTDVAPKHQHISRARVCDLFLDTPECNAHTTAADVLWSGTPLLTFPRYEYKMCSRMAASILRGALPKNSQGDRAATDLIVSSDEVYEEHAVELGSDLVYPLQHDNQGFGTGRLMELRRLLYESRWTCALFDTRRWVKDLEDAYEASWNRWVAGEGGDIWL